MKGSNPEYSFLVRKVFTDLSFETTLYSRQKFTNMHTFVDQICPYMVVKHSASNHGLAELVLDSIRWPERVLNHMQPLKSNIGQSIKNKWHKITDFDLC